MKNLVLFSIFILSFSAFAQNKKPKKPQSVIWTAGNVEKAKIANPNSTVLTGEYDKEEDRRAGYIAPGERNAILHKVGIEAQVAAMDDVDLDMLMTCARTYTAAELISEYPMLNEAQASKLIAEVRKRK